MRRLLIATLFATVSGAALAAAPGTCSLEGFTAWPHPADLDTLPRAEWPKPEGGETCATVLSNERLVGDTTLRFSFAFINRGKYDEKVGAFVTISRLEGDKEIGLGRFAVPLDLAFNRPAAPDVQVVTQGSTLFASLSRTDAELFALQGDKAERVPNAGWYGELIRSLQPKDAIGRIVHFDLSAMTAIVAVHGAHADDVAAPGSAFSSLRFLRADLDWREGAIVVKASSPATIKDLPGWEPNDDEEERLKDIRKRVGKLPPGTEMCWLSAYSTDRDPNGLNVRAEPSAKAAVLGQLAPPLKDAEVGETLAKEVSIIGYKNGWFLIDTKIDEEEPTNTQAAKAYRKRWFSGRGWVNARMLGASTAYSGFGEHKLFAAPNPYAHWTVGREKNGDPLTGDSALARIHACSFDWALVESAGGQRGWRRRLCSNQLTTCP